MKRIFTVLCFCFTCFFPSLSSAQTSPVLRVCVGHFYPPFIYNYGSGFDIALANALCRQMNTTCVFYSTSLEEILTELRQGKLDLALGAISLTPERMQYLT